jgi:BlaI family transcriptional regulator, penicillinase repressor
MMEQLSGLEEKAMMAIWQTGAGFVKDFMVVIPEPKPPYTTLASTVKTLEKKGFLKSERFGHSIRYRAKVSEGEYKKRFMNGFVSNYFKSNYKAVVASFVKDKKLSAEDLKEIIKLIENPEQ